MVFHASLARKELPGWSRCMSPALLTSFLHSAFLFYILIATAVTNYGKKKSLPSVSIFVHLVSPSKPRLALLALPTGAPFQDRALLHRGELIPTQTHPLLIAGLEGKSKWIATQRTDKTDGSLCLFCSAQSSLAVKASNEDNDE